MELANEIKRLMKESEELVQRSMHSSKLLCKSNFVLKFENGYSIQLSRVRYRYKLKVYTENCDLVLYIERVLDPNKRHGILTHDCVIYNSTNAVIIPGIYPYVYVNRYLTKEKYFEKLLMNDLPEYKHIEFAKELKSNKIQKPDYNITIFYNISTEKLKGVTITEEFIDLDQ